MNLPASCGQQDGDVKKLFKNILKKMGGREEVPLGSTTVIRSIQGDDNSLHYKDAQLNSVKFDIVGNGNRIIIKPGCVMNNVTFFIRGDGHRILIRRYCRFNGGGSIWLEGEDCSLDIGRKSTFENVHLALTEHGSKLSIGKVIFCVARS